MEEIKGKKKNEKKNSYLLIQIYFPIITPLYKDLNHLKIYNILI